MLLPLRISDCHFDVWGTFELSFLKPKTILLCFGKILISGIVSFEEIFSLSMTMELHEFLHRFQLYSLWKIRQFELILLPGHDVWLNLSNVVVPNQFKSQIIINLTVSSYTSCFYWITHRENCLAFLLRWSYKQS